MQDIENGVISHYEDGALLKRILAALTASGIDIDNLQAADLAPVEEFHIGGRAATQYLVEKIALTVESKVLDVGCGIGGAARYMTTKIGNSVTGIDLTPEYIAVAKDLTERLGLTEKLQFETASALAMPFENAAFDAAITLHVAMNIPDRAALYAEIARLIKPGGKFCLYDVMSSNGQDLVYPVPWAETAATSHLISPETTLSLLHDAGFEVYETEDRSDFAVDFFEQSLAAQAKGPAPLGLHLLMGDTAREKFKNVLDNIVAGRIAPVQMLARKLR